VLATVHIGGTVSGLEALREWLRVPRSLSLPAWVAARLSVGVARELDLRRGLALDEAVFGIVDLETTGLSSRHARILEIGLVVLRGETVLARLGTLVDVAEPLPSGITALTGIHDSLLEGAPSEGEALESFARLLAEHRVDALVAHNARFDRAFLRRAWREHARPEPLPPFLCSVRAARRLVRAPRFGLDALVAHLSIPPRERHRALGDAEMTADLWRELLGRARLEGMHTLESLSAVAAAGRSKPPRRRIHVVEVRASW
jgi:DNA polymerase III subunit epsilon